MSDETQKGSLDNESIPLSTEERRAHLWAGFAVGLGGGLPS